MIASMYDFQDSKGGAALAIRIVPGSQENEIDQILSDGTIKIKLISRIWAREYLSLDC